MVCLVAFVTLVYPPDIADFAEHAMRLTGMQGWSASLLACDCLVIAQYDALPNQRLLLDAEPACDAACAARLLNLELAQKFAPKAWQANVASLDAAQHRHVTHNPAEHLAHLHLL